MAESFVLPEFLQGITPETIQLKMMQALPADIDDMPGGFPYDFTMPAAIEKAELINYTLVRALMIMFPQYAWGTWLDLHGQQAGLVRHEPNKASGTLTISGKEGTEIPKGTIFCVPASGDSPIICFTTDAPARIGQEGFVDIAVTAAEPGISSNVKAGTVTLAFKPIQGIDKIENKENLTGGTEQESDDNFYQRIALEYQSNNSNYIGNDTDYKRWAKMVPGIGDCIVMPFWAGPGTVKLVLIDENGSPANEKLLKAVYDYIVSPDDRSKRILPTGTAELTVAAAATVKISYQCTGIQVNEGYSLEQIKEEFKASVGKLYEKAKAEGKLRYNQARSLFTLLSGVKDFDSFTINGGMENISFLVEEYPVTDMVDFT